MVKLNENYIVDKKGHKLGVFLNMKSFSKIQDELEELADIRAFDEAKSSRDESIPFTSAVREIEKARRKCTTK
jgi:hypothetical protein